MQNEERNWVPPADSKSNPLKRDYASLRKTQGLAPADGPMERAWAGKKDWVPANDMRGSPLRCEDLPPADSKSNPLKGTTLRFARHRGLRLLMGQWSVPGQAKKIGSPPTTCGDLRFAARIFATLREGDKDGDGDKDKSAEVD
jgi:hypothetical protein